MSGADAGLVFVSGALLDQDSTGLVPEAMHGRLLLDGDLRRLARTLAKKPPARRAGTLPPPKRG